MAFRGPKVRLWRWRRNPLKRRSDTVEGWIVLGTWVLGVLAGVLAGWTAARGAEHAAALETLARTPTVAKVTERAPGSPAESGEDPGSTLRVWGKVRWSAPDGTARTGWARVWPGSAVGTEVAVWTDSHGRLVTGPATPAQARTRAVMAGGLVGLSTAAVPFATGHFLRARLERRRLDQWDAEWARFGPLWSRKTW
ncbi:Rv1733c family protein [Streptomyces cyslabdanicus]|uniref:Rv1733c family protein n=1 Tax=Streptomyces cyslabdanicus TaxID=1470456 RepID=UPI0040450008